MANDSEKPDGSLDPRVYFAAERTLLAGCVHGPDNDGVRSCQTSGTIFNVFKNAHRKEAVAQIDDEAMISSNGR